MRKLILGTAIFIVALCLYPSPIAAQSEVGTNPIVFVGARYDDGLLVSYGLKLTLTGNLSVLNYVDY